MHLIVIAYVLYLLFVAEQYNEGIDKIISNNSSAKINFEPTFERLDDQFFTADSHWQQYSDAEVMTDVLNTLEQAGYSRDLEGYIEASRYVPQRFSWTDPNQNELNLLRSYILGLYPILTNRAYYYEQNGDITRVYFEIGQAYYVLYETESTVISAYFVRKN